MNYRTFKKDFRMTAAEYERFDRVRRTQGFGYRPWSEFILDALKAYVATFEAKNRGRFPPAVTPPSLIDPFREHIREKPTPIPAEPVCPTPPASSDKKPAKKQKARKAVKA